MSLKIDFSKPTCRFCLQNNQDEMSSIFDVGSDFDNEDLCIFEQVEKCTDMKILHHDNLPTLICKNCYELLTVWYKFRTICRNSEDYLKAVILEKDSAELRKTSPGKNPLIIVENNAETKATGSLYKKRQSKRACSATQNFKSEPKATTTTEIIKIERNYAPVSPALSENSNDGDFDEINEIWFDADENKDLDFDTESLQESDTELEKPAKHKKQATSKVKKKNTKKSKLFEVSSNGAQIVRGCKPRVKKEKQPHICEICGNIYQRRHALNTHRKIHTDQKKAFECEICGYAFYRSFELERHMRTHTGVKPYKCSFCPRTFGDQSSLIKHERIHRNERPFKCEICGKSFTYSNVLKHHMYTHTGEKPYSCELCGKTFSHSSHVRSHLETLLHRDDPRAKELLGGTKKNRNLQQSE